MRSNIQPGKVVFVYKIETEGEVTKVEADDTETRYHVRIPEDDDVYVFSKEELHVFSPQAEENIRREWKRQSA